MATQMLPKPASFKGTKAFTSLKPRQTAARRVLPVVAAQQVSVEIEKPIGVKFKASSARGGGCVVTSVSGNGAKSGIKVGDTIIYTSSFFGEELWPADAPAFVQTAINRAPSPVYITYVKGDNNDVMVKRLPKKAAPARFGRKLTATQMERATHICVDCGYIYSDVTPFEEVDPDYRCPQCKAPKKRFAKYNAQTGKKVGGTDGDLATLFTVTLGLAGVGVLAYLGLTL